MALSEPFKAVCADDRKLGHDPRFMRNEHGRKDLRLAGIAARRETEYPEKHG